MLIPFHPPETVSAVTLGTFDSAVEPVNGTSFTLPVSISPGLLLIGIGLVASPGTTVSAVTVHVPNVATDPTGTAASSVVGRTSGGSAEYRDEIWKCSVAAGSAAEVKVTAAASSLRCGVGVLPVGNANATEHATASNASDPMSTTIDCPAGGVVFAVAAAGTTSTVTWTLANEGVDTDLETGSDRFTVAYESFAAQQTGLTVTADPDVGTPMQRAMVVAAWGPA